MENNESHAEHSDEPGVVTPEEYEEERRSKMSPMERHYPGFFHLGKPLEAGGVRMGDLKRRRPVVKLPVWKWWEFRKHLKADWTRYCNNRSERRREHYSFVNDRTYRRR